MQQCIFNPPFECWTKSLNVQRDDSLLTHRIESMSRYQFPWQRHFYPFEDIVNALLYGRYQFPLFRFSWNRGLRDENFVLHRRKLRGQASVELSDAKQDKTSWLEIEICWEILCWFMFTWVTCLSMESAYTLAYSVSIQHVISSPMQWANIYLGLCIGQMIPMKDKPVKNHTCSPFDQGSAQFEGHKQ